VNNIILMSDWGGGGTDIYPLQEYLCLYSILTGSYYYNYLREFSFCYWI